jgi:hypothetical protein
MNRTVNSERVVVVLSESDRGGRAFTMMTEVPDDAPELPSDIATEAQLVKTMEAEGYRLHLVGGGSTIGETRRFYFRKTE